MSFNHIEPLARRYLPYQLCFQLVFPPPFLNPLRSVASLFLSITLFRYLYLPLLFFYSSFFPLEIRLSLEVCFSSPSFTYLFFLASFSSSHFIFFLFLFLFLFFSFSVSTFLFVISFLSLFWVAPPRRLGGSGPVVAVAGVRLTRWPLAGAGRGSCLPVAADPFPGCYLK